MYYVDWTRKKSLKKNCEGRGTGNKHIVGGLLYNLPKSLGPEYLQKVKVLTKIAMVA